jgi:hypothetical protein
MSSTTTDDAVAASSDQLRGLVDRAAVGELLDRFILALDEHDLDDGWLRTIVTEDVRFEFPLGRHEGVDGLAAYLERPMAAFEDTQHLTSNAVVDVDRDRATLKANMIATHVHPPDHRAGGDAGPLVLLGSRSDGRAREVLVIGTHMDGEARRTEAGWRLRRLTFRLSWILGEPPGRAGGAGS